ncbi:hypothetical protein D3C86_2017260 [compost metagenome]
MIAGHALEALGDRAQNLVARVVAVGVVDLLEMIEIEDHQPDRPIDAAELAEILP